MIEVVEVGICEVGWVNVDEKAECCDGGKGRTRSRVPIWG